jgi:hypothetical protein
MDDTTFMKLLEKGEGIDIEFKREFPKSASDMAREFGALTNTEGGVIFIGVNDNGEKIGVQEPDKLLQRLAGVARENCEPALNPEMDKKQFEDKWFVFVNILRQRPPVGVEGKYYIRVGPTTRRATNQELEKLFKDVGIVDARILNRVDVPRDFMYLDKGGIDGLYARFIDNSSISSSLPYMVKLQELLEYLATKRGKDFFENLSDAVIGCSISEEGVFINIKQKFDAPQFLLYPNGVDEINSSKSVSFEIGFADPYDYDDKNYKKICNCSAIN